MYYKDKRVQRALDIFIAEPTIPEGLKILARKAKNGTLATKEEMVSMETYRKFRQQYFMLYETIPAIKNAHSFCKCIASGTEPKYVLKN